jgi:hypothetical protein
MRGIAKEPSGRIEGHWLISGKSQKGQINMTRVSIRSWVVCKERWALGVSPHLDTG